MLKYIRGITIGLVIAISGCSAFKKDTIIPITEDKSVDEVRKEVTKLMKFNRDLISPPLDLSTYKGVKFNIVERDGKNYIFITYEDYKTLLELLKVLEKRILEQEVQIEEIINFYDNQQ